MPKYDEIINESDSFEESAAKLFMSLLGLNENEHAQIPEENLRRTNRSQTDARDSRSGDWPTDA